MTYLNDHHSQVLAKLRALISLALQQLYHTRFHYNPPPMPLPRARSHILTTLA